MLRKFAIKLDEIADLQGAARPIIGMITPHPQRHSIAGISQVNLAIWFRLTGHLRRRVLNLCVDTRHDKTVLRSPANFAKGEQFRHRPLRLRHADYATGETPAGIAGRLRF